MDLHRRTQQLAAGIKAELVSKRARSFIRSCNPATYPLAGSRPTAIDRAKDGTVEGRGTPAHTGALLDLKARCFIQDHFPPLRPLQRRSPQRWRAPSPKTCGGVSALSAESGAKLLSTNDYVIVSREALALPTVPRLIEQQRKLLCHTYCPPQCGEAQMG